MPLPLIGVLLALLLLMVAELTLLVEIAGAVGVLQTIVLLILIGALGMMLVRRQGLAVLRRMHAAAQAGQPPIREMLDAACILVAGILMALPGFITDVVACALLLPPVRGLIYNDLTRRAREAERRAGQPGPRPRPADPAVIEGEFEEIEPVSDPPGRRPGR